MGCVVACDIHFNDRMFAPHLHEIPLSTLKIGFLLFLCFEEVWGHPQTMWTVFGLFDSPPSFVDHLTLA